VRAQAVGAGRIAAFLKSHSAVEAVHYPGLADHPGHAVAARQMTGFGGMLSLEVRGGRERAMQVAARVQVFTRATSLGGTQA
jgi:cystathionine gamma-synthase